MRKLSKKYVLVDEDLYERKFKSEARASSKPHPYNPFTNPSVTAAKRNREGLLKVASDETLDVNNASLLLQQLVQQYAENFAKATTKQRRQHQQQQPRKARAKRGERGDVEGGEEGGDEFGGAAAPPPQAAAQPAPSPPSLSTIVPKATPSTSFRAKPGNAIVDSPVTGHGKGKKKARRLFDAGEVARTRVEISPMLTVRADEEAVSDESVTRAIGGGHLNDRHLTCARNLLAQMKDRGLVSNNFVPKSVDDGDLQMSTKVVKNAIRNLVTETGGQTRAGQESVRNFVNYLKKHGIKVDMRH